MRNELIFGFPFEFWCKVVLYSSVSPKPFPFCSVCRGPETFKGVSPEELESRWRVLLKNDKKENSNDY